MTRIGKGTPFVVGALVLLACTSKEEQPLSPPMQEALRALAGMPLVSADLTSDGGASSRTNETQFGDTEEGEQIVTGIGSRGPTGNGAGNGGVGTGTGPGNGGVGTGTGPGNGGVGTSTGAGGGGVSSGLGGGAGDLASAVCDFLNAFCVSLSKCDSSKVDLTCNFSQQECISFVNELLVRSKTPVSIPPGAVAGLRCVSNALRTSDCLLTEGVARSFEANVRACGLPVGAFDSKNDSSEPERDTDVHVSDASTGL
ncbi:MAG TPA: hypothetical protein VM925_16555 [Labilithrix sp.]|nr:hypothetical protein [Labilithrix sp.]